MKREKSQKRTHRDYFTISKYDKDYLQSTVSKLKKVRQKTNKSELVGLAIAFLRDQSVSEIEQLLRDEI